MRAIDAVRADLAASQRDAAIAVCDDHGELIAFLRTDGCRLASIQIAMNKAFTAAREQRPTADVGRTTKAEGVEMTAFGDLRYNPWGGGVPIVAGGVVVGAIGVSGLNEVEDAKLASLGAAAITES